MKKSRNFWLPLREPVPGARLRLLCFPYAGGAAAVFRTWSAALAPESEVCAIEYPGRWGRHREALETDARRLAALTLQGVSGVLDQPFALFGYSFGTLVAFEFARALREHGLRAPEHMIVAAGPAPHVTSRLAPIHTLPRAEFIREIDRRYAGLPAAVQSNPELLDMVLPVLRADMTAVETYVYEDAPPLDCDITAISGTEDTLVNEDDVAAWRAHTSKQFASYRVAGGHFFANTNAARLMRLLRHALAFEGLAASINGTPDP